jgi:hypothetical protein
MTMHRRRVRAHVVRSQCVVAGLAAAALLVSGCSGGSDEAGAGSTQSTKPVSSASGSAPSSAGASGSTQPNDGGASAAGIDPANPPKPLGTVTIPAVVKDDPKATLKIDLLGLKRQDKMLIATYAFTVTSTGESKARWLYDYLGDQGWSPTLVDTKNLKLHKPLRAPGGGDIAATSYQGNKFAPGQVSYAFAVFGAPPEDVREMTVNVSDGAPPLVGMPIQ